MRNNLFRKFHGPESAICRQVDFFDSAIDGILKTEKDNPTVGMLICKSKKKTVVEYSLKDMNKPIGVSEYQITIHY
jgi:hypothetical protein